MTPEQIEELQAIVPKDIPAEFLAVSHIYVAFLGGTQALSHVLGHTDNDEVLPDALREAGKALFAAIDGPMRAFQDALEAASEAASTPELRAFAKKVIEAQEQEPKLESGVLDFSNVPLSKLAH